MGRMPMPHHFAKANFLGSFRKFGSRILQDIEPFLSGAVLWAMLDQSLALGQFGVTKVFKVQYRPALAKAYQS